MKVIPYRAQEQVFMQSIMGAYSQDYWSFQPDCYTLGAYGQDSGNRIALFLLFLAVHNLFLGGYLPDCRFFTLKNTHNLIPFLQIIWVGIRKIIQ
jgi:hypothetical protein